MANQDTLRNPSEDEIDLIDYLKVVLRYKRLVVSIASIGILTTCAVSALMPNMYTSTATLMPIDQNKSSSLSAALGAMGGTLGMLTSQAGLGLGMSEKFETLLKTRTLSEGVINKLDLLPILFEGRWSAEEKKWKSNHSGAQQAIPSLQSGVEALRDLTSISADKKSGVVSISVSSQDPSLSARIANAYLDELDTYLIKNSLSSAKRNRVFIESQLDKAKRELSSYETSLRDFQKSNNILSIDAQTESSIKAYSDLKSKLISAEVELSLLKKGYMEADPRVTLKEEEIREIRKQLNKFEAGDSSGLGVSFQEAPSIGLKYARIKRELLIREKVFELLTQQYEMAKIQEAQEDIAFQILDRAIPPENKSGPKRLAMAIIGTAISIALGAFAAIAKDFWTKSRANLQTNSQ